MLVVFLLIFMANTQKKMIFGYNFVAPLSQCETET